MYKGSGVPHKAETITKCSSQNNVHENKKDLTQRDKVLLQRLLVAKDAGREMDLKKLLCHELSPVPFTIADTAETQNLHHY